MKICPVCESNADDAVSVCQCGHSFDNSEKTGIIQPEQKKKKKKINIFAFVTVITVILCLGAGAVGGFFAARHFSKVRLNERFDGVLIFENNQLLCADASRPKAKPLLIAELEGDTQKTDYYYEHYMSPDNKRMLFTNNYSVDKNTFESTYDVFLYDFENPSQQVKIASGVSAFCVNEAFDTATCLKGEGKKAELCQYSLITGESETISDDIEKYSVSEDGSAVIYQNYGGDIFVYTKENGSTEIHKRSDVVDVSEDFSCFFFVTGGGNLAKYDMSTKKKTVIEKKVTEVFFDNGKGYYLTEGRSFRLADYFTDDMLEQDEWISTRSEEYDNRLMRDSIRRQVSGGKYDIKLYNLYYFDGHKALMVDEDVCSFKEASSEEKNCGVYSKIDTLKLKKLRMSEITDALEKGEIYLLKDYLLDASGESEKSLYICADTRTTGKLKNISRIDSIIYNSDKKTVYFCSSEEKRTKVYSATVKTGGITCLSILSENAAADGIYFTASKDCFYLEKKADGNSLYFDGNLVKDNLDADFRCGDKDRFIIRDSAKNEKGSFIYTLIESGSLYCFESKLDIDGKKAECTEKGAYILKDEGNTIVVKGERVKKATSIPDSFFVPRYPEAVICEVNTDYTILTGADAESLK